jgi:dsDNA-specific endonuclease/ATPase MutS2
MKNPKCKVFNKPVDPVLDMVPDYLEKIESFGSYAMDLQTIMTNLWSYRSLHSCFEDIRRVFENAIRFNDPSSFIHHSALAMKEALREEMRLLLEKALKEVL